MRVKAFTLAATAFLAGSVQAVVVPSEHADHAKHIVTAASVSAETAEGMAAMQMALKIFPPCALKCLGEVIPKSPCNQTDVQCLCTNEPLNAELAVCIQRGCTKYESLMSKNASMTMCHPDEPLRDETQKPLLIAVIGGAIAVTICGLRMMAGLPVIGREFGWDDWTILLAVALTMAPTVFAVLLAQNGLGRDIWTLPMRNIENILFLYYLGEIFYFAALTATKVSILLFVLRVFPDQSFRRAVYGVIGLCLAYGLTFIVATMLQCMPLSYSWKQIDGAAVGRCNNIHLQGWMSAIGNIIVDLIILVLPLRQLYMLQINLKKKVMIMFMFSFGIFVTIVSVVRLRSLIMFANSQNITWDYNEAAYWSTIELYVGIVCACLPSLRALFVSMGAKVLGSAKDRSKFTDGSGNKGGGNSPRSGTFGSGGGGGGEKLAAQGVPRRGDESDFVPLVEMDSKIKAPVGVPNRHSADSLDCYHHHDRQKHDEDCGY